MKKSSIFFPILIAGWFIALVSHSTVTAQKAAPEMTRSTNEGIYSDEQAARGQKTYGMTCLGGCHNAASHKGPTFKQNWLGHPVVELFDKIKDTMPDDNPGALSAKETIDVVSYLLKANGAPAGKTELAPEKDALAKIKIEIPAGTLASSRNR